jgi:hypothetical protein
MSVHEVDPARAHERAQPEERRDVRRPAHAEGHGGEIGGPGFAEESARGLTHDEGVPSVVEQPSDLVEDPDLLTAKAEGGFGMENQRSRQRRHAVPV